MLLVCLLRYREYGCLVRGSATTNLAESGDKRGRSVEYVTSWRRACHAIVAVARQTLLEQDAARVNVRLRHVISVCMRTYFGPLT